MDLRGSHIQELEDLRVQTELEVAEAKRELTRRKFELERQYEPGTTPAELLDQNEELKQINSQM
jgi:hypothetical protein